MFAIQHVKRWAAVLVALAVAVIGWQCAIFDSGSGYDPDEALTLAEARGIVISQVLDGDLEGKIVFEYTELNQPRQIIETHEGDRYLVTAHSWLFFIDEAMDRAYPHPCKYVLVNSQSGRFRVIENTTYPLGMLDDLGSYNIICSVR